MNSTRITKSPTAMQIYSDVVARYRKILQNILHTVYMNIYAATDKTDLRNRSDREKKPDGLKQPEIDSVMDDIEIQFRFKERELDYVMIIQLMKDGILSQEAAQLKVSELYDFKQHELAPICESDTETASQTPSKKRKTSDSQVTNTRSENGEVNDDRTKNNTTTKAKSDVASRNEKFVDKDET